MNFHEITGKGIINDLLDGPAQIQEFLFTHACKYLEHCRALSTFGMCRHRLFA